MENTSKVKSKTKFRRSVHEVICNVEIIMTGIRDLLGEMGTLVQQIDKTAESIEAKIRTRRKETAVILDANQNQCKNPNTLSLSADQSQSKSTILSPLMDNSNSKQTLSSPYIDYTYLELMSNCDICDNELGRFTYNEKYPLWIQYDTWRTGNTPSDISLVSGGSDVTNNKSESNNNSWKSAGNLVSNSKNNKTVTFQTGNETGGSVERFGLCCIGESLLNGHYCGVYEQMMEEHLESIFSSFDTSSYEDNDLYIQTDKISNVSLSLSDEFVVHYNKTLNSWTAYKTETDLIESTCSTCS